MPMRASRLTASLGAALVTLGSAVAGAIIVSQLTAGLSVFTSESWRRAAIEATPRAVPVVDLQDESGRLLRLDSLCGRVMVLDFVYTHCPTVCKALGASSSQLARRLRGIEGLEDVVVMSVSFDPERDTPDRLQAFKRAMEPSPSSWRLARPVDSAGRRRLLEAFGVVTIPDGMGGYDHNAALHVVDQQCRLVRVLDADDVVGAEAVARRLVVSKGA